MGTPAEDAAYQRVLTQYRVWCQSIGQQPDPGYIEELARLYNQGLHAPGMGPATPQPTGPAVPGGGAPAVPGGAEPAPAAAEPTGTSRELLEFFFPDLSPEELDLLEQQYPTALHVQQGWELIKTMIETGGLKYQVDANKEIALLNNEAATIANEIAQQNADTMRFYNEGLLEEMGLSREQEAVLARELNALNKYIAEMQNQVATLGLQISERAYGAQLGAHPVNTVEFELWKRAGGSLAPVDIPEAPVPQEPVVPEAPTVPTASTGFVIYSPKGNLPVKTAARGRTARPGEIIQVGEGKGGWEYLRPGPGTVVAPRARGERTATMEGGQRAIQQQLGRTQQGTDLRRQFPGFFQNLWGTVGGRPTPRGGRREVPREGPMQAEFREVQLPEPLPTPTPPPTPGPKPPPERGIWPQPEPMPGEPLRGMAGAQGKRVPYGWMKRRRALGFQGGSVPGAQYGYVDPGTHTDEEMAAAFASAMAGLSSLYDPSLTGIGQFGERIPGPGEVSRRQYYSMNPSGHEMLKSHLASGFEVPEYGRIGGETLVMNWLRQMQRSWIPGLEGAKRSVQYAY